MKRWATYFLFTLLWATPVCAQTALLQASVNKNKILIGEPFWLTLEIKTPESANIQPFKLDSLAHFEFLTKDSTTTMLEGGVKTIRQYYQLTSFDSGKWVIPPIALRPHLKTPSILIDVVFSEPFDPKQPYHDIQDIRSVKFPMDKNFEKWWYGTAVSLILLTLLVYWLTLLKKPAPAGAVITEPPYQKAKRLLDALKKGKPATEIFYTGLIEIFREYIFEKTGIRSLHNTSTDLLQRLRTVFKNSPGFDDMARTLQLSDLVKFAKYKPTEQEAATAFDTTAQSIRHIEEEMKRNPVPQATIDTATERD